MYRFMSWWYITFYNVQNISHIFDIILGYQTNLMAFTCDPCSSGLNCKSCEESLN